MKFLLASVTLFAGLASTMAQTQPSVKTFKTFDDTGENPDPFDFEIGVPTLPLNTDFDGSLSGENEVGPFEFDLEGNDEAAGFSLSLASCPITGDDAVTPPTALGDFGVVTFATGDDAGKLGQTFVLKNPDSAFTTETWCIRAQLFLPEAGTDKKVAELDYTLTVNVQANGGFDLTASSNVKLPDPTGNSDIAVDNTVDGDVSVNEFIRTGSTLTITTDANPIVLGTTVPFSVTGPNGYKFTFAGCSIISPTLPEGTSSSIGVGTADSPVSNPFNFDTTNIPIIVYTESQSVQVKCAIKWTANRRALRALQDASGQPNSGTIELSTTVPVATPTGSGASGVSMAASALALGAAALLA